jgi:polar amino acid transport system substrate-binding protein
MNTLYGSYLRLVGLILLLLISCSSFSLGKQTYSKDVTLATHNLPPYGSYQHDGTFKGIAFDKVACALNLMKVELNLLVRPWSRAQLEVKKGLVDGFFAGSKNDEREGYAVSSVQVADQKWQWYLLKDSKWDVTSTEFKTHAKVSSFLGANMEKWLKANDYNVTAVPTDTEGLAAMMLIGRVDAALANNYVMDQVLEKMEAEQKVQRYVLKSKPLHVYFAKSFIKENSEFLSVFNSSIHQCNL